MIKSIDFDRFMTPECTKMLSLAFTSKTGKSEANNRRRIFCLDFSVRRMDAFRHFIGQR